MKNLFVFAIAILSINQLFAQPTIETKNDEFTNILVKKTSYEKIIDNMSMRVFIRASQIKDSKYINIKLTLGGKIFSIFESQYLMLKLKNDSIISLPNIKTVFTCTGCGAIGFNGSGAQGIEANYLLKKDDIERLKYSPLTKIRIYTSNGFVEENIKEKNSIVLQQLLSLIEK